MQVHTLKSAQVSVAPAGHPARPVQAANVPRGAKLGVDHIGSDKTEEARTYKAPKPRGRNEITVTTAQIVLGILGITTFYALFFAILYYVAKGAVHNGIRQAAREGAIGNDRNRLNAAS